MPITTVVLTVALAVQTAPAPSVEAAGRAYFLFLQGRTIVDSDAPGAIARFREALTLLGDSPDIRAELAGVYARQGQIAEARAEAERAVAVDANNRAAHRLLGLIGASEVLRARGDDARAVLGRAIAHLERALSGKFRDPQAQLALADCYIRAERYDPAIVLLNDFLLDRPEYPQAMLLLAQAYRASGRTAEADAVGDSMFGGREGDAPPTRAAQQLEQQGQWKEAAVAWAGLAADEPENRSYRLRQATALANSDQVASARRVLTDVIQSSPKDVAAYYLLVQIELRDGQAEAAEAAATKIGEIDREDPRGPLTLAEVRASRRNHRGVVAALEGRVGAAPEADIESGAYAQMAALLSHAFVELKDEKRAVGTMEMARKKAPDDLHVLFSLAAVYEQTRQFDRAEKAFRDLIAADPSHAAGLNYLGYMLAERGRKLEEAVTLINRALQLDEDNPSFLDSLGWAYFKQAKYTEAVSPLERAASASPESAVIQEHLGDVYMKLKRYRDAEGAFSRALDAEPEGADMNAIRKKRDASRSLADGR
jgi:tetratricopeptide (TPR) repeat protein